MTSKELDISTAHLQRARIELHRLLQLSHGCSVVAFLVENLPTLQPCLRLDHQRMQDFSASSTFSSVNTGVIHLHTQRRPKQEKQMHVPCVLGQSYPAFRLCLLSRTEALKSEQFHRFQ